MVPLRVNAWVPSTNPTGPAGRRRRRARRCRARPARCRSSRLHVSSSEAAGVEGGHRRADVDRDRAPALRTPARRRSRTSSRHRRRTGPERGLGSSAIRQRRRRRARGRPAALSVAGGASPLRFPAAGAVSRAAPAATGPCRPWRSGRRPGVPRSQLPGAHAGDSIERRRDPFPFDAVKARPREPGRPRCAASAGPSQS